MMLSWHEPMQSHIGFQIKYQSQKRYLLIRCKSECTEEENPLKHLCVAEGLPHCRCSNKAPGTECRWLVRQCRGRPCGGSL